jgi:hypothetical protein
MAMRIPRPLRRAAMVCGALPLLASCSDATGPSGEPRVTEQREVRIPGVTRVLYSPIQGKLYALQPGGGKLSVVEIDPATGRVERTLRDVLTEEGWALTTSAAVSADAPFLYLARGAVVHRVALDRMAVDLTVTMGGGNSVGSVVPLPGSSGAFAVMLRWVRVTSLGDVFWSPVGVAVYDGATQRPVRYTPAASPESIVALSGTRLVGFDYVRVHDLAVSPDGVVATEVRPSTLGSDGPFVSWHAAGPYVLSSNGEVLDTRSWTIAARFDRVTYSSVAVDVENERVFYLQDSENLIRAFSLRTLHGIAGHTIPGVTRGTPTGSLVMVGSTGLALVAEDRVIILPISDVR